MDLAHSQEYVRVPKLPATRYMRLGAIEHIYLWRSRLIVITRSVVRKNIGENTGDSMGCVQIADTMYYLALCKPAAKAVKGIDLVLINV
jgi:hypothetical protein